MYHELPRGASFWLFLLSVDQDLARTARQKACSCGGRMHQANYPRKPRGSGEKLPAEYCVRWSFCCDRDGCRKRVTPPSVRIVPGSQGVPGGGGGPGERDAAGPDSAARP
jgi:hypothetical protein